MCTWYLINSCLTLVFDSFQSFVFPVLYVILWFIHFFWSPKHSLNAYNIPDMMVAGVQRFKVPEESKHLTEERDQ